mmetsp:Transcript_23421/g.35455  ORF Transcript_23421/g.35455 Transcript_23421/m.35455 type:complete len:564 (-) Transcript_23421:86-1777(-)
MPSSSSSSSSSFHRRYFEVATVLLTLSWFSYVGEFIRVILEKLGGAQCLGSKTPGACVASDGMSGILGRGFTGGAVFLDLPVNALGCFLMGLGMSGDRHEHIPIDQMPLACFPRRSFIQKWSTYHLGFRTGFCGALTTFASWNTQMVVMICDGQWAAAIFGYMLGLALSLASYECGRHVAILIHRCTNPDLKKEADLLTARWEKYPYEKQQQQHSAFWQKHYRKLPDHERRFLESIKGFSTTRSSIIMISSIQSDNHGNNSQVDISSSLQQHRDNDWSKSLLKTSRSLPDSERRFLYNLQDDKEDNESKTTKQHQDDDDKFSKLRQWKDTTDLHRRGLASTNYQQQLRQLEQAILIDNEDNPDDDLLEVARDAGWDVSALQSWKRATKENDDDEDDNSVILKRQFVTSAVAFVLLTALLIIGIIFGDNDTSFVSRPEYLSALVAPLGTLTRWYLSKYNGTLPNQYTWLPIGTLAANLLGSILSALAVGISKSSSSSNSTTIHLWMTALKTGYAGCLSTVSTLVSEIVGLMQLLPRYAYGYYYALGTIVVACLLGTLSYVWFIL